MKAGQAAKNAGQVSKCIRYACRAAKAEPGNGSSTCSSEMPWRPW